MLKGQGRSGAPARQRMSAACQPASRRYIAVYLLCTEQLGQQAASVEVLYFLSEALLICLPNFSSEMTNFSVFYDPSRCGQAVYSACISLAQKCPTGQSAISRQLMHIFLPKFQELQRNGFSIILEKFTEIVSLIQELQVLQYFVPY